MNRILIATDGSPSAQEAVDFGLELAADRGRDRDVRARRPGNRRRAERGFGFTGAVPHELRERTPSSWTRPGHGPKRRA